MKKDYADLIAATETAIKSLETAVLVAEKDGFYVNELLFKLKINELSKILLSMKEAQHRASRV